MTKQWRDWTESFVLSVKEDSQENSKIDHAWLLRNALDSYTQVLRDELSIALKRFIREEINRD